MRQDREGSDFHPEFYQKFQRLAPAEQDELLVHARVLEQLGPMLERPWADTLKGARHANMKELRFNTPSGVWRIAFASIPIGTPVARCRR